MPTHHHIGCSGFSYKDWRGRFYPDDLPQREWLAYYATHFATVEINNSFYRLPTPSMVRRWREVVPRDFRITLKGSRYVTHLKKLKDPGEHVAAFYEMAEGLRDKLACVLWQLPRNLPLDLERLDTFCAALDPSYRNVIEFRHASWWEEPEVRTLLRRHKIGFCILSAPGHLPDELVETASFAYVRFHGTKFWYRHDYSDEELRAWARRIATLKARNVYVYFNNDVAAHAVGNALTLRQMLEGDTS